MGTTFLEVASDEHGIGSSGKYCGDNDSHLGRINVFYLGRAVLFDLEHGVIGAVALSRRSANSHARKTSLMSTVNH